MRTLASLVIVIAAAFTHPASTSADDIEDPSGHFRLDVDRFGLQAWALAQFPVSDDIAIAGNIYAIDADGPALPVSGGGVRAPWWRPDSRVDAGVIFRLWFFELFPKLGLAMDLAGTNAVSLVPQLFAIVRGGPIHFETWNQLFLNSVFQPGTGNVLYMREQLLASIWNLVGFGFQLELTLALSATNDDVVRSLPIGGTIQLQPSESDVIQAFIAYEADDVARGTGHGLTGRLTYLHTL